MDDARPRDPRHPIPTALTLGFALLIGGGLGLFVAWKLAPRSLARFEARAGEHVAVDWSADAARERVLAAAVRETGAAEPLARARRELRRELAASVPAAALPAVGPAGECAARLDGLARVLRALAAAAPAGSGAGPSGAGAPEPAAIDPVRVAAGARDPAALDAALAAELEGERRELLDRASELDPRDRFLLWSEWRARAEARATEFEYLAAEAEALEPAPNRASIAAHAALRALALEGRVPDPSGALLEFPAEPARLAVRPLRAYWGGFALGGMLAGGLAVALGIALGRGGRRRAPLAALAAAAAAPGDASGWLHVVAGARGAPLARAVLELAAHPLARRDRVVVVDASRRARLHERLGLSARLGFAECASRGLPALGLIQSGGFTGLFLLSRGGGKRVGDWLVLDRVLEELRPHFARVVVAFDDDAPAEVGGVLAGRVMRGWWAGPAPASERRGERAGAALATALADLELAHVPEPTLAALEARLVALAGVVSLAPIAGPEVPPPSTFRVSPPAVLEGDLKIRQRLRYLAWMRRVRREGAAAGERR